MTRPGAGHRVLLALCIVASVLTAGWAPSAHAATLRPIRAAFYYPWYPEHWARAQGRVASHYKPTIGYYNSSSLAAVRTQIHQMRWGGINVGISSWWGQGSPEDRRLPLLLKAAQGTSFKWTLYYELPAYHNLTPSQIHKDLAYIVKRYAGNSHFLRFNGRPVIFVYDNFNTGCVLTAGLAAANVGIHAYLNVDLVNGWQSCTAQPDAWHYYAVPQRTAPVRPTDHAVDASFSISPGYWPSNAPASCMRRSKIPCLPRSLADWRADVRAMKASGARWQLITTFNEWNEGTGVESATAWRTKSGDGAYLDALRQS